MCRAAPTMGVRLNPMSVRYHVGEQQAGHDRRPADDDVHDHGGRLGEQARRSGDRGGQQYAEDLGLLLAGGGSAGATIDSISASAQPSGVPRLIRRWRR